MNPKLGAMDETNLKEIKEPRKVCFYVRSPLQVDRYPSPQRKILYDFINEKNKGPDHWGNLIYWYQDIGYPWSSRRGLKLLLEDVRNREFDTVVAVEPSHMTRSPAHLEAILEEFTDAGATLIFVKPFIEIKPGENVEISTLGQVPWSLKKALRNLTKKIIITKEEGPKTNVRA